MRGSKEMQDRHGCLAHVYSEEVLKDDHSKRPARSNSSNQPVQPGIQLRISDLARRADMLKRAIKPWLAGLGHSSRGEYTIG